MGDYFLSANLSLTLFFLFQFLYVFDNIISIKNHLKFPNHGKLPIYLQLASGAIAGTAQTIVTNPLEIVKIRKQLDPKTSISKTVRDLGIRGIYKGILLVTYQSS